jgi:threonine dehydrogenase-like Zn-dependent dehydrogenase
MEESSLMRAARLIEPQCIEIQHIERPLPGPNEVRMRIEGCGVCGSNLAAWSGLPGLNYPLEPGEPGHEAWGFIDRLGSAVHDRHLGERCAFLSSRGFAEYAIADAASLVPLPAHTEIFPGEALACALNIHRRSEIRAGQTVALVGVGFIGALLVRLASRAGARVIALSRREYSLQIARRFGAVEALCCQNFDQALSQVMELTRGKGCERVVEAAGTQESLDLASALVSTGGRLIVAGYHQDGPRRINLQSWNWRGIDVINAHERDSSRYVAAMQAAAAQIASGVLDPAPLYTHDFPLEQCSLAFKTLEMRPPGFVKAFIRPGGGGKTH